MKTMQSKPSGIRRDWARRSSTPPKAVGGSGQDLVKLSYLKEGPELPLVIEPKLRSVDLFEWVKDNREFVEEKLLKVGGLLFRGFGIHGHEDFSKFLEAASIPLLYYREGATPRTQVDGKVYTSTEFPPDERIALHNELCYVVTWPMKILFFADVPAEERGATPIADVRKVFKRLSPSTREKFVDKGWMLVRNFGAGFGPSWQGSYRVETREELEEYLSGADISFEWRDPDDPKLLRTRQVRPAIAKHPKTKETVWFNHISFWHDSNLEKNLRETLLSEFAKDELPYSTYYGDGSPIPDEVATELAEAYDQETVIFPWQEGDLLLLDNMLVAHGRDSFRGERRILAAMGEACSDRGLS